MSYITIYLHDPDSQLNTLSWYRLICPSHRVGLSHCASCLVFWFWVHDKKSWREATDLEQLYANDSKHELKQESDEHNVVDGTNGNDHTLNHVLLTTRTHTMINVSTDFTFITHTMYTPLSSHRQHNWHVSQSKCLKLVILTQRRSVAKSVECFQRRLFVCLFVGLFVCQYDNFRTSKHRMMKLGVDALYKNLGRIRHWGS